MNFVKTKEFKIGIITAVCFFILIYGLNYLKGVNLFKPSNYYLIEYKNVEGLEISSPVKIDGFKVGLVTSVDFDYQTNNNVVVEVSLDKKLRIPQGSKMILKPGLMGGAELDLKLNTYVSENHA
ncbi:MAG: MlaD family protein, partial [Bacteroidales bacterium]